MLRGFLRLNEVRTLNGLAIAPPVPFVCFCVR